MNEINTQAFELPASRYARFFQEMLEPAGIRLNGSNAWDIRVHDARLLSRVVRHGTLGLGEAYMEGWWDCPQLDQMICRAMLAGLEDRVRHNFRYKVFSLLFGLVNRQTFSRAFEVGRRHYDLGNDLFEAMLDTSMNYSCGYWRNSETLEDAQKAKMDLICRKLELEKGMRVLDVGCGFGGLAHWIASQYDVSVAAVTVSEQQASLARERCANLPVTVDLVDYRQVTGTFDRIVSVGMFEHVGPKNYRTFFSKIASLLQPEGLFLLHTIGAGDHTCTADQWTEKYIFPNGVLPSMHAIVKASEDVLVMEDWHNFGADYDPTLMAWYENLKQAWPQLRQRYDERFRRMFEYYLLISAGSFRARANHLWQVMFSKHGIAGGYSAAR